MKTLSLMLLLALLAAPAFAALKGQAAPDFTLESSVTTQPEHTKLDQCKAEVVLIKLWGVR
ncbi:MAG: hypothetical protein IT462_15385 [Planctomycetes bacterium]|nr:hypothetical protein [Planctomycetota bacterium]